MLGNGHVRFGRRAAETGQSKDRYRAAARPHTYVSTWSGWCYTAFVIDAYARRILGWSVATTMTSQLVVDAVEQAIWTRQRCRRRANTDPLTPGEFKEGSVFTRR